MKGERIRDIVDELINYGQDLRRCPRADEAADRRYMERAEYVESLAKRIETAYAIVAAPMNHLYHTGCEMREAQKDYFKTRDVEALRKSKCAERAFDAALEMCRNIGKPKQEEFSI